MKLYNEELVQLGSPTWCDSPWLFTECYLYRRLACLFSQSTHWKAYDVFAEQKISTFRSSRSAVAELAARWNDLVRSREKVGSGASASSDQSEDEEALFREMCDICLWGNATDLSLLTSLSHDDIQKLQGAKARKESEKNILANDLPAVFALLKKAQDSKKESRRVDIVLDNAGFELFVDLLLAGYLLLTGLATTIVLHPKSIPWFVSDVTPNDFASLLGAMGDPQTFYASAKDHAPLSQDELDSLQGLFASWSAYHASGQLIIRPNRFWTHAGSFHRLPEVAPELYEDLLESELVILKGDLNYRKLTGDAMWDPTTPFSTALGLIGPGSGLRILALRTCKADVVVGLPPGEDERIRKETGDEGGGVRKWAWSGKYAVVQFCDGSVDSKVKG